MVVDARKETVIQQGEYHLTKNPRELIKAIRVATSIVVVAFDPTTNLGGMIHMAMPDSKITINPGENPCKFVDLGLPIFIEELVKFEISKASTQIKIVGGSQLFNFGGGSGNLLNIGTRNAITARTILTREGLVVEKTDTGGNKPRTVMLDIESGQVQVIHPGETPRVI